MKIAVPLFGDRVSPHFGASTEILLVETQDAQVTVKSTIQIEAGSPGQMARHLAAFGVNTIICGGIQQAHKLWLTDNGIRVLDNQKGLAEELVSDIIASDFTHKIR